MSVNSAPGASPGFFRNTQAPVEVHLSINLKEIEYWLQEDVAEMIKPGTNFRSGGKV